MLALVLSLFSVVVLSQDPRPCETPLQWSAVFHRIDQLTGFYQQGRYFYDALRTRTAEEHYTPGLRSTNLWRISLWNANPPTRYDINTSTSTWVCTKSTIPYPWRPYAIGPNDVFVGAEVLGSTAIAGAYVDVNRWQSDYINGTEHNMVTLRGCVPVRRERIDNTTNPNNIQQEHWYDDVIGIPNPNVFVPPPQCA